MMKKLEQIKKLSQNIRLSADKKDAMRNNLVQFMAVNPILEIERVSVWEFITSKKFVMPAGAFALLLLVGGGTSFAAEKALPGEALYAVKTQFNEPVAAALHASPVAKASWHARVAERRLEEVNTLAASGKLTAPVKAQLEVNFEKSAQTAANTIAELNKEDAPAAVKVAANFESTLKTHAEAFTKIENDKEDLESNTEDSEKVDASTTVTATGPAMAAPTLMRAATVKRPLPPVKKERRVASDTLILKIQSTLETIAASVKNPQDGPGEHDIIDKVTGDSIGPVATSTLNVDGSAGGD